VPRDRDAIRAAARAIRLKRSCQESDPCRIAWHDSVPVMAARWGDRRAGAARRGRGPAPFLIWPREHCSTRGRVGIGFFQRRAASSAPRFQSTLGLKPRLASLKYGEMFEGLASGRIGSDGSRTMVRGKTPIESVLQSPLSRAPGGQ
jgi:hypothetical protein